MKLPPIDYKRITARAIELLGGHDKFFAAAESERSSINARWNQNVETIGRILRAHLFVEHFITEHLQKANPRLGSLQSSRATFSIKVSLLQASNPDIASILPGIKRLNSIRNRLAHNLDAAPTDEDRSVFLACERYAAMRAARDSPEKIESPLEVLEGFAMHVAMVLNYEFSPVSKAIAQAIEQVHSHAQPPNPSFKRTPDGAA